LKTLLLPVSSHVRCGRIAPAMQRGFAFAQAEALIERPDRSVNAVLQLSAKRRSGKVVRQYRSINSAR
jgi:hypothetical protein